MSSTPMPVLIVDNATTCAMRVKTLVNMQGTPVTLIHWTDWEKRSCELLKQHWCLLLLADSIPRTAAETILEQTPSLTTFIICNDVSKHKTWQVNRDVNVLLSSLSSSEIISSLEPYWVEDFTLLLPDTLVIDDNYQTAKQLSKYLTENLLTFQLHNDLNLVKHKQFDMIVLHLSEDLDAETFLPMLRKSFPTAGLLVFGEPKLLSNFRLAQCFIDNRVDALLDISELDLFWYSKFAKVWQKKIARKEEEQVTERVQTAMENLLRKNLIMQVLFATSSDGVVAFDLKGQVFKVNEGFAQLVGAELNKVKKVNLFEWLSRSSRIKLEEAMRSESCFPQLNLDIELIHEQKIGISVSVSMNRINTNFGIVMIGIFRNVTSQNLQTKILSLKNQELEHRANQAVNEKEDLKKQHISSARKQHRFIRNVSQYLADQVTDNQNLQNKLQNLGQIFKIKDQRESAAAKPVNLAQCVNQAIEASNMKQAFQINIADSIVVHFTPSHLAKIFQELLANVSQYADSVGAVNISVIGMVENFIEIAIADIGDGINEISQTSLIDLYDANEIVQPFKLVTGIPLCALLMKLNHGKLYLTDHVDQKNIVGNKVLLKLPMSPVANFFNS